MHVEPRRHDLKLAFLQKRILHVYIHAYMYTPTAITPRTNIYIFFLYIGAGLAIVVSAPTALDVATGVLLVVRLNLRHACRLLCRFNVLSSCVLILSYNMNRMLTALGILVHVCIFPT